MQNKNVVIKKDCHIQRLVYGLGVSPTEAATKPENIRHNVCKLSGSHPTYKVGRGFTLIELLVVVLIIGILAAVAVPQYQKAVWKSRATSMITLLQTFKQGLSSFVLANGFGDDQTGVAVASDMLDVTFPSDSAQYTYELSDHCYSDTGCTVQVWYKNKLKNEMPTLSCDFTPNFKWSCACDTTSQEEAYVCNEVIKVVQ